MMEIKVEPGRLPERGTVIVPVGHDGALSAAAAGLDGASGGLIRRALEAAGEKKHGRVIDLFLPSGLMLERLLLLVVGKPEGVSRLDLEQLGGKLVQKLKSLQVREAHLASIEGLELGFSPVEAIGAMALGAQLRAYRFTKYRTAAEGGDEEEGEPARLWLLLPEGEAALAPVRAVADAVCRARDLVSEPANVLTPKAFAEACADLADMGVEVEILARDALEELGMRALLAVAQGSALPPYVAVMRWQGGGSEAPLALVGKGICFDTGGISIKPAQGMEEMKWDMAGAAAVYGAMLAVAGRKARANVVGVVGLAENMPSGTAQRPGDVIRSMAGKTIEVVNTDAEGRLLLADVLHYTKERFKPRAMIDLATLTGAVIVALGHEQAGLFANDESLAQQLQTVAEETGELLWRLPLGKAYEKHIRSDIADIKNVGRGREAGSTAGAVFLQQFVGDVPWAHLDIAAMAWTSRDQPLAGKGATGFGVRLLDRLVARYFEAR
ncbi:leucyl aminopeptidase [Benzoatithermus flavus]|uniref:Probable cytosol aminopeptidase n=1 Tax=Benzoatithermus flavus TaxID=3108223 RepID=A0ABU8XMN4_9PROT